MLARQYALKVQIQFSKLWPSALHTRWVVYKIFCYNLRLVHMNKANSNLCPLIATVILGLYEPNQNSSLYDPRDPKGES